jgi:hypothetical protein
VGVDSRSVDHEAARTVARQKVRVNSARFADEFLGEQTMSLQPNRRKNEAPYYLCETDYFPPNPTQIRSALKGRDVIHDQRQKRGAFWRQELLYGLLVLVLLILTFGALFIIAEAIKG